MDRAGRVVSVPYDVPGVTALSTDKLMGEHTLLVALW